jgi:parallel beta-helix repeat protein
VGVGKLAITLGRGESGENLLVVPAPGVQFPPVVRGQVAWADARTLILPVKRLRPSTQYALQVVRRSESGETERLAVIRFTTAAPTDSPPSHRDQAAADRVLTVPDDHPTLAGALAAARSGDEIQVKPGRYRESVVLRPGVRLSGTDRERCVIEVPDEAAFALSAEDCRGGVIENLTMDGRGTSAGEDIPDGIVLIDASVTVRNCVLKRLKGNGVWVRGAKSRPTLIQNTCTGNGLRGIEFAEGARGSAERNTCSNNRYGGIGAFGTGTAPRVISNTCSGNGTYGIGFCEGAGGRAAGNTCGENGECGITVSEAAPHLQENACRGNTHHGIYFEKASKGMAEQNTCEGNRDSGIGVFDRGTAPNLKGNTARGNRRTGIYFGGGAAGVAEANLCEKNGWDGIGIAGKGTRPTIRGNRCHHNGKWGIDHWGGAQPQIAADNQAEGNTGGQIKP